MSDATINPTGTIRALRGLIFAALIIPTLLFVAAAWRDQAIILRAAEADAQKLIAVFQGQAENLFKGHKIILDLVVSRLRDQNWDAIQLTPGLLNELETVDNMLDDTSAILVLDASGTTRATTLHASPDGPMPPGDSVCFLALQRGDLETCLTDPYLDPVSGQHLFSLTRRLEKAGTFSGMAQVAISADFIMTLWAAALPRATDTIAIVRSDGVVLAQPSAHGAVKAGLDGDDGDRIPIVSRIADYPARISLGLDRRAILANWYWDVVVYAVIAIGSMTGIVLALGMALRRARTESRAVARWQAEARERERAQDQLLQSQKMESLGKLTGSIAHDFNNLLTVIVGNTSMLTRYIEEPDGKRQLRSALQAGESAVALTQRLLSFARKRDLQLQSVDLLTLVEGMRGLLVRTLGEDIRLVINGDAVLWPTLVDPNQMELVILNLAINARDAMPGGGTLSITLSNRRDAGDAPDNLARGDYVVLCVADTGTGMDAATLARATEPFFTTKGDSKGTGLGLSMMEGVVGQSGGATRLRSTLGEGTDVEVWLPRTKTLPRAGGALGPSKMAARGAATILVCDDNIAVLEILCDALRVKGYTVSPVESGRAALAALQANPSTQLLIADFAMPEMNGAELIRQVRALRPELPILLVTGNADPDAVQDEIPGVPMLTKPFSPEQLAARVGELLRRTPVAA